MPRFSLSFLSSSRKASGSVPQPSHPKPEAPEPPAGTSATTPPDTLRASKGRRLKRRRSSLTAITRSAISSPMPKAQDTETTLHTEKGTDVSERGHPREGSHNQSCAKSIQEDQEANFTKAVTHIEPDAGHTGANSPVAVQNCTPNVSDLPPALSSPSSEIGRTSSIDTTNTGGRPPRLTIATNPGPSSVTSSSPVAASSLSSVPGSGVRRVPSFFRNSSSRHLDTEISGTIVSRSTKSAGLSLKGTFVEPHEEEASEKRFPLNPIPQPSTSENGKGSLPGRFLRRSTSLTLGASATSPRPAGTNEPAERPRRPPVRKVTTPVPQPPPTQIGSRPPVSASVPEPPGAYMSKIAQAFAARSRSSTKASKDTEGAVHPNPNAGTTSVASPTGATFGASGQPQNQPVDARTSNAQVLRSFLKAKESGYFVTKRSGRRHHAFPMSECPYPVACDKEALDLDIHDLNHLFLFNGTNSLIDWSARPLPQHVLDLGCGSGAWILAMANEWPECRFVGFDIVPVHPDLKIVDPQLAWRVQWVYGNFLTHRLPFPDGTFDLVNIKQIAKGVPEDKWDFVFEEVARVLKPNGAIQLIEEDIIFPVIEPVIQRQRKTRTSDGNRLPSSEVASGVPPLPVTSTPPSAIGSSPQYAMSSPSSHHYSSSPARHNPVQSTSHPSSVSMSSQENARTRTTVSSRRSDSLHSSSSIHSQGSTNPSHPPGLSHLPSFVPPPPPPIPPPKDRSQGGRSYSHSQAHPPPRKPRPLSTTSLDMKVLPPTPQAPTGSSVASRPPQSMPAESPQHNFSTLSSLPSFMSTPVTAAQPQVQSQFHVRVSEQQEVAPEAEFAQLERLFNAVFERRFINMRPTSLLPNLINIHFTKTTVSPYVVRYMPSSPTGMRGGRVDVKGKGKETDARSSTSSGADHPQPTPQIRRSQSQASLDSSRRLSLSQCPPDSIPGHPPPGQDLGEFNRLFERCVNGPAAAPDLHMELNPTESRQGLALQLHRVLRGVLACKEAMWEELMFTKGWAAGDFDRPETASRVRLARVDFDALVERYRAAAQARIALDDAIERSLHLKLPRRDGEAGRVDAGGESSLQRDETIIEEDGSDAEGDDEARSKGEDRENEHTTRRVFRRVRLFCAYKAE